MPQLQTPPVCLGNDPTVLHNCHNVIYVDIFYTKLVLQLEADFSLLPVQFSPLEVR